MWWLIPTAVTAGCAWKFFEPIAPSTGDYDFGPALTGLLRLFWLMPVLAAWLLYYVIGGTIAPW